MCISKNLNTILNNKFMFKVEIVKKQLNDGNKCTNQNYLKKVKSLLGCSEE